MATRRSLTSRGFTSVNAGVSSTNRFLNPPRVVGEYTTVAEDLRSTKNAVGPAAQPLRPRARVDASGGGDGYSPTATSAPIGMNQALNAMIGAQNVADVTKYTSFVPGPVGVISTVVSGAATAAARAADVTYSNMRTDKENSNAANRNSSKIGFLDNVTQALTNPIDSIVDSIPSFKEVEETVTEVPNLVQDALSFVSLGAVSKSNSTKTARAFTNYNNTMQSLQRRDNPPDQNRKSMLDFVNDKRDGITPEQRREINTRNTETLRIEKEIQQQKTLNSRRNSEAGMNTAEAQQTQRDEGSYGGLSQSESESKGGRSEGYGRSY